MLNGTKLLDDVSYYDNAKKSVFYFAKKTGTASDIAEALMSSDMDSVNRLAGQFKVKVNAMQRGKDLMISNDNLELHVFYSDNPSIQLSSDLVLQEAALAASNSAWFREKSLVTFGFTGYGDWTNGQQKELLAFLGSLNYYRASLPRLEPEESVSASESRSPAAVLDPLYKLATCKFRERKLSEPTYQIRLVLWTP